MKKIKLELTEQEANALIQILDISVKAKGLEVANNALVLNAKIQQAAKDLENKESKDPIGGGGGLPKPKK